MSLVRPRLTDRSATCFFLGIVFAYFPYDYNVLWATPASLGASVPTKIDARDPYYTLLETHLRFIHAAPPVISRILHIVIGTGLLGFMTKLYHPSEANLLFDGASLVLYICGIVVYYSNIVATLRTVTEGSYGRARHIQTDYDIPSGTDTGTPADRSDSLKYLAASNTILALIFVGVLVLQAGQWYANKKEQAEIDEMDRLRDEKRRLSSAGKKAR